MGINTKVKGNIFYRNVLFTALFVVTLLATLITCIPVNNVSGASLADMMHVKNETELKNAINNALNNESTTIALDNDITLSYEITIPANKDITLTRTVVTKEEF